MAKHSTLERGYLEEGGKVRVGIFRVFPETQDAKTPSHCPTQCFGLCMFFGQHFF